MQRATLVVLVALTFGGFIQALGGVTVPSCSPIVSFPLGVGGWWWL